jgi:hypothetical protein
MSREVTLVRFSRSSACCGCNGRAGPRQTTGTSAAETDLSSLIAAGETPLLVDVRGATTQQADPRRIPGSIAVTLDALEARLEELRRFWAKRCGWARIASRPRLNLGGGRDD